MNSFDTRTNAGEKLKKILFELSQDIVKEELDPRDLDAFNGSLSEVHEYIHAAGELGISYEIIIAMLEAFPIRLSGKTAVLLVEVALLFQYKTERPDDAMFDLRRGGGLRSHRKQ